MANSISGVLEIARALSIFVLVSLIQPVAWGAVFTRPTSVEELVRASDVVILGKIEKVSHNPHREQVYAGQWGVRVVMTMCSLLVMILAVALTKRVLRGLAVGACAVLLIALSWSLVECAHDLRVSQSLDTITAYDAIVEVSIKKVLGERLTGAKTHIAIGHSVGGLRERLDLNEDYIFFLRELGGSEPMGLFRPAWPGSSSIRCPGRNAPVWILSRNGVTDCDEAWALIEKLASVRPGASGGTSPKGAVTE